MRAESIIELGASGSLYIHEYAETPEIEHSRKVTHY